MILDFILLMIVYIFIFYPKWKTHSKDHRFINTLLYIYVSFVLYFTLMPIAVSLPFIFNHPYKPMNLIPFSDVLSSYGDYMRQIILNVIMMTPLGFLLPHVINKHKFLSTLLCAFLFSLCIELIQPLLSGFRSSDITDLITNTIGGLIGYLCYMVFYPFTAKLLQMID